MSDHAWADTRARAVELFQGETPRAQLEQDIVNVFVNQPALVIAAVEQVGLQFAAGKVRSGWAVLRTHVVNAAAPATSLTVSDTGERDKRVRQAEQRIRATGHEIPTAAELLDDVFGDRGLLKAWTGDVALRERMLALWGETQPQPVAVEGWAE